MRDDRLYPARPILAVSTAVFRDRRVLLARRARPPLKGAFSLPGGVVEVGETLEEAAVRELHEEVGIEADLAGFVAHVQPISRDRDRVRTHFVIAVFAAQWRRGEPGTSVEADAVVWADPSLINDLQTTPKLFDIVARAAAIVARTP